MGEQRTFARIAGSQKGKVTRREPPDSDPGAQIRSADPAEPDYHHRASVPRMAQPLRPRQPIMLELRFIHENLDAMRQNCRARGVAVDLDRLVALDDRRRALIAEQQSVQEKRNKLAKEMKGRKPSDEERALGKQLKDREAELEAELVAARAELEKLHALVPNMTHPAVPQGATDVENKELRRVGEPTRFSFRPLDHVQLAAKHDLIDFEGGAKTTGQKFYFLKNEGVLLELALVRFALDLLRAKGFTIFQTPDLAQASVAEGIGFNPRGEESNIYSVADTDFVLVGTAEITLGALHRDQILDAEKLPLRYCGVSHCFRREAGAHGRESKGLYRVHQFTKVEMFAFTRPEDSEAIHAEFVAIEEELFAKLEIPFRVVDVCTGDLGAPAYRKFDLEAWMPGRGESGDWGEITSTSNCTDYQARRLAVRYRETPDGMTRHVHMLNGTAIALSRGLIALLETHQRADGSIEIPKALRPYTGFDRIG
jgi:seryl-tRNA synthetase